VPDAFPDVSDPNATPVIENVVIMKSNNTFTVNIHSKFMTLS
jgi:hypothetical protein